MAAANTDIPADVWGDVEAGSARSLLLAALAAFSERGYAATTTRDIARRVLMSPAAVYVHYKSKSDLLCEITRRGHGDVLTRVEAAVEQAGATPHERLAAFVEAFVWWHAENHTLARVIQYELRSLPDPAFAEARDVRNRFEEIVHAVLAEGMAAGEFAVTDIDLTTIAVLSLGIDVARWFTSRRTDDPRDVARLYADLVTKMVSATATTVGLAGS